MGMVMAFLFHVLRKKCVKSQNMIINMIINNFSSEEQLRYWNYVPKVFNTIWLDLHKDSVY